MTKSYVLYHANCLDGMMSAAIAYKFYKLHHPNKKTEYIPVSYNQNPPLMDKDSIVYILDFSYPSSVIMDLMADHEEVWVLDHHKTALKELRGLYNCFLNMNKSGAMMTWDYFFPSKEVPYSVQMIQDRDLWTWKLPDTKSFTEALYNLVPFSSPEDWQFLLNDNSKVEELINTGKLLLEVKQVQVKNQLKQVYFSRLPKHQNIEVPFINSNFHVSETCEAMYTEYPDAPFVVQWHLKQNKVYVSLRSSKTGADVSEIAKLYGGGGHHHAAGCSIFVSDWFH